MAMQEKWIPSAGKGHDVGRGRVTEDGRRQGLRLAYSNVMHLLRESQLRSGILTAYKCGLDCFNNSGRELGLGFLAEDYRSDSRGADLTVATRIE